MTDQQDGEGRVITPANAWQRPPFQPGHTLSVTHGAFSPRRLEPVAATLIDHVIAMSSGDESRVAHLARPEFRPALVAWARDEARCQLLHEAEIDHTAAGRPVPGSLEQAIHRAETRAASRRHELGMTPLAFARLRKDLAIGGHVAVQAQRELQERYGRPRGEEDA